MEHNGKIIIIDWGCLMFSAIFAHKYTPQIPVTYTVLNMVLANLLKVGVQPEDTIMIACDKGHSWRKEYDVQYKSGRKEGREKHTDINWKLTFEMMNDLLVKLDISTNWHIIQIENMEADDIEAVGTKYFPNNQVILITFDADLEQLLDRPNVKIFSPKSKKYKFNANPLATLAKKLNKEAVDGLTNPILNEEDFDTRNLIINLRELPEFVETPIINKFKNLEVKTPDLEEFPFFSLKDKYLNLCNDSSKIVTIEKCAKEIERKKKKKSKKPQHAKSCNNYGTKNINNSGDLK
jgi:hypothetical protein